MTEKELLQKLNNLRAIKPATEFKAANRLLLLAQISQGEDVKSLGAMARLNIFFSRLFRPYAVAIMIVLFFAASGVSGWQLSHQAQPGDSLYLAKRLSERTKMLMTVDDKAKNRLNLEFAGNRVAEINLLRQADNQDNEASAEHLKSDFKKEISQVKERLTKFNIDKKVETSKESDDFVSAGAMKDGGRIEVSVPVKSSASSTATDKGIGEVLEEVQQLFEVGAYEEVAHKLDQVNGLISQVEKIK